MAVFDDKGTQLGSIIGFQDFGAGDLIEVELPSGATGLVPFADSMVPIVDMDESRIVLSESGVAVLHADVELTGKTAVVQ
jgi:16S rRNA processing protein RimM